MIGCSPSWPSSIGEPRALARFWSNSERSAHDCGDRRAAEPGGASVWSVWLVARTGQSGKTRRPRSSPSPRTARGGRAGAARGAAGRHRSRPPAPLDRWTGPPLARRLCPKGTSGASPCPLWSAAPSDGRIRPVPEALRTDTWLHPRRAHAARAALLPGDGARPRHRAASFHRAAKSGRVRGRHRERPGDPVACATPNERVAVVALLTCDAGDLAALLGPADLLLSNILRLVNTALLPAIVAALRPGGLAIFSGMEELEAPLFRPVLAAAGLEAGDEVTDTGWWAVAAARP